MKKLLAAILSTSLVMVLGMGVGCTPEKKPAAPAPAAEKDKAPEKDKDKTPEKDKKAT